MRERQAGRRRAREAGSARSDLLARATAQTVTGPQTEETRSQQLGYPCRRPQREVRDAGRHCQTPRPLSERRSGHKRKGK